MCISCKTPLHNPHMYTVTNSNLIVNKIDNVLSHFDSVLFFTYCKYHQKNDKPDLMEYMNFSRHLSIDSGFALDYIYDCYSAEPTVYIRADNAKSFDSMQELEKKYYYQDFDCNDVNISKTLDSMIQVSIDNTDLETKYSNFTELHDTCKRITLINYCNFLHKIKTVCYSKLSCDGTVEGFFELAVFKYLYDCFGLRGHSNVNQRYVIASAFDAQQKIERCRFLIGDSTADKLKKKVDSVNFNSRVIVTNDTVEVNYFCFAPGKGIYSKVDIFQKKHPYQIYGSKDSTIVKSAIAVMF